MRRATIRAIIRENDVDAAVPVLFSLFNYEVRRLRNALKWTLPYAEVQRSNIVPDATETLAEFDQRIAEAKKLLEQKL